MPRSHTRNSTPPKHVKKSHKKILHHQNMSRRHTRNTTLPKHVKKTHKKYYTTKTCQEDTQEINNENKKSKIFAILNKNIDQAEVEQTIKNLKSKKAPGYDRISNEIIKCTNALIE